MSHGDAKFGAWDLARLVGEGGFADVQLARLPAGRRADEELELFERLGLDRPIPTEIVVKRLHEHLAQQHDMVDMFVTEARVLGALDHPAIVAIYALARWRGRWAMWMQHVHGWDLAQIFDHALAHGLELPVVAAVQLVADIAAALHHAHERNEMDGDASLGIIHRDVKPDNILVTAAGRPTLIDFGCAKATLQTQLTRPGIRKGTLDYMSPEQCLGRQVDRRTDIFSLGVVLYELITMTRMYADVSDARVMERIAHEVPRPPSWHDDRVNASLDLVALRALEKRPEDRFATMAELARALQWWMDRYGEDDGHELMGRWMRDNWSPSRGGDHAPPGGAPAPASPAESGGLVLRARTPSGAAAGAGLGGLDAPQLDPRVPSAVELAPPLPGTAAAIPGDRFASLQGWIERRSNVPAPALPLRGRDAELAAIERACARGCQLVALAGRQGSGRSALLEASLHAAAIDGRRFHGGVWRLSCAGASGAAGLLGEVAHVLDIELDAPGDVDAFATVGRALAARGPCRLGIDDAEMLDAGGWQALESWGDAAPELELLVVTSAVPHGLRAEVVDVGPLPLPRRADELERSPLGQLWLDRLAMVAPRAELRGDLAAMALALLRTTGGLPGPVVLAAAQLDGGDLEGSLHRVISRAQPPSQRALDADAMDAALQWTVSTLAAGERALLAAASLCHGGMDLELAQGLAAAAGGGERRVDEPAHSAASLAKTLDTLRQRALLTAWEPPELPGTTRWRVARVARELARADLMARAGAIEIRRAHADTTTAMARRFVDALDGPDGVIALRRLRLEAANLAAVAQRALRVEPPTGRSGRRALAVLGPLWWLAERGGHHSDWLALAEPAAQRLLACAPGELESREVSSNWSRIAVAHLRRRQPDLSAASDAIEAARRAAAADDEVAIGRVAWASGVHELLRGDPAKAALFCDIALDSLRQTSDRLDAMAWRIQAERGLARWESALAMCRQMRELAERRAGHPSGVGAEPACRAWFSAEAAALQAALLVDLDDGEAAVTPARAATAWFDAAGDGVRAARARLVYATALLRTHAAEAAAAELAHARDELERAGRDDVLGALPRELAALDDRRRGRPGPTQP